MCHLATWLIDGRIDEHHGKLFMKWQVVTHTRLERNHKKSVRADLVMKKYPHIHVSVSLLIHLMRLLLITNFGR